jgi:hypothetical protein
MEASLAMKATAPTRPLPGLQRGPYQGSNEAPVLLSYLLSLLSKNEMGVNAHDL